jgi:hypothetical protein
MLKFHDWLRANATDRDLYAGTKRELAQREWKFRQKYADAKTLVVETSWRGRETLVDAISPTRPNPDEEGEAQGAEAKRGEEGPLKEAQCDCGVCRS